MRKTLLFTGAALVSFAANSLLCRQALRSESIDPASFTLVRIGAGALALSLLMGLGKSTARRASGGRIAPALALFLYAAFCSYAYVTLDAGIGALVQFTAVQITMIAWGSARGEYPRPLEWAGGAIALAGLGWLVLPGVAGAPPIVGVILMTACGAAWGVYSSLDRRGAGPLAATTGNFQLALIPTAALALAAALAKGLSASPSGILLAATSGAIASGIGYAIWYTALPALSSTQAAVVQLLVPVLAAFGGVILLGEVFLPRTLGAAAAILLGVSLAVLTRARAR